MRTIPFALIAGSVLVAACSAEAPSADVDTSAADLTANCPDHRGMSSWPGPASWAKKYGAPVVCLESRYDCGVAGADRRYENPKANDSEWPIAHDTPIVDGRGIQIDYVHDSVTSVKLNLGQTKMLGGKRYVYAFAVGNATSGWVNAACIGWDGKTRPSATCVDDAGDVPAGFPAITGRKPPKNAGSFAKYEVDVTVAAGLFGGADLTQAKITCNASGDSEHRSLADYVPHQRSDGSYTINLILTLPGMHPALGGTASDTFRVAHMEGSSVVSDHLTFYRLTKVRAVSVDLFAPDSTAGAFKQEDPRTVFVYGYVVYPAGKNGGAPYRRRYGWIDFQALKKS